ncbi:MAG: taurine dioxygenase [Halieaceae bacterium]|jgi:taurine dioxygenase
MSLFVKPSGQVCGAEITGLDLTQALDKDTIAAIRAAWMEHHVVSFPDQPLSDNDLERFSLYFGDFGHDPFIAAIEGRKHVIAVERKANEQAPLFAENWHTDWSFQVTPPAGTCLFGITIPPQGGDTLYADQHKSLAAMPAALRQKLAGKFAIHSAKAAYAPEGMYGKEDQATDRSMRIKPSAEALDTELHLLIGRHPETDEECLFGCVGYIVGIDGMNDEDAFSLLLELHEWQTQPQFVYTHQWRENMLVMWDNRSVLHRATGGYEGFDRLLHRTTIAASR